MDGFRRNFPVSVIDFGGACGEVLAFFFASCSWFAGARGWQECKTLAMLHLALTQ